MDETMANSNEMEIETSSMMEVDENQIKADKAAANCEAASAIPSENPCNSVKTDADTLSKSSIFMSKDGHYQIKLRNIVSTVSVACELNLQDINNRTRNSEYIPARFHGIIMRMVAPSCTALIFRSGKIICTGARNEYEASLGTRKFVRLLQLLGYDAKFVGYRLQNIVATVDIPFPIDLENLHNHHAQFTSYEPELFPAVIYRLVNPRLVVLIFVNGCIIFVGAKSKEDIVNSLDLIYPVLLTYRKS